MTVEREELVKALKEEQADLLRQLDEVQAALADLGEPDPMSVLDIAKLMNTTIGTAIGFASKNQLHVVSWDRQGSYYRRQDVLDAIAARPGKGIKRKDAP